MASTKLLLCVLIIYCCSTVIQSQVAVDCCLNVSQNKIPKHLVRSYRAQVLGEGCSINAMIFNTKKNKNLCAPMEPQWVRDLMKHLDHMLKKCQDNRFKSKRCQTLKNGRK